MDKTILITGATGGIGGAAVEYFIHHGWHVIAPVRSLKKPEAQALMARTGVSVFYCDVESPEATSMFINSLRNDGVRIDRVFLAAGMFLWDDGFPGPILPYEEVRRIVHAANLTTKENVISALRESYGNACKNIDLDIVSSHAATFVEGHPFRTGETIYADTMGAVSEYGIDLRTTGGFKSVAVYEPGLIDTPMARAAFTPDRAPDVDWSKAKKPDEYIQEIFATTAL